MAMDLNWDNLARCLIEARGAQSQPEVVERAGVSLSTIQKYEQGRATRGGRKLFQLTDYYGWTRKSVAHVLAGGEPEIALKKAVLEPFAVDPADYPAIKAVLDRLDLDARQQAVAQRMLHDQGERGV